jgi:hypothetical protein
MKTVFSLLFLLLGFSSFAQNQYPLLQQKLDSVFYAARIDSLRADYAQNKKIPKAYELEILLALSYFPELKNTKITFKTAKIKTTLNARPTVGSLLFKKRQKRHYVVRINTSKKKGKVLFPDVPFDAKVGLLGHEFCHFIDYNHKHLGAVLGRLFAYLGSKSKEHFEKEIDEMAIDKGLGWQLYAWSYYVLNDSKASEEYKAFKAKIYLEPDEILELMEANEAY